MSNPENGTTERGCVYFAHTGRYWKIGYSTNPNGRLYALRHDSFTVRPQDINLPLAFDRVVLAPASEKVAEAVVHVALRESKAAGEWFHDSPEVQRLIEEIETSECKAECLRAIVQREYPAYQASCRTRKRNGPRIQLDPEARRIADAALRLPESKRRKLLSTLLASFENTPGRPRKLQPCPKCGRKVGARDMRRPCPHE